MTWLQRPFARFVARAAHSTHYVHGDPRRLRVGRRCSLVNTVFNTASGNIIVGDDVIFGHNCMVLTGRHEFENGMRRRLASDRPDTPQSGFDIRIGDGTWVASGATIVGGVTIGRHCIIAAGAVVTRDVPDHVVMAGVPAKVIRSTRDQSNPS